MQAFGCKVNVDGNSGLPSNVRNEPDKVATLVFSTWRSSEFRRVGLGPTSQSSTTYPVSNFGRAKEARLVFLR